QGQLLCFQSAKLNEGIIFDVSAFFDFSSSVFLDRGSRSCFHNRPVRAEANPKTKSVHPGLSFLVITVAALTNYPWDVAGSSARRVFGWGLHSLPLVESNAQFRAIGAGYYHSVALKTEGSLIFWGNNEFGQCTPPGALPGIVSCAAGYPRTY